MQGMREAQNFQRRTRHQRTNTGRSVSSSEYGKLRSPYTLTGYF